MNVIKQFAQWVAGIWFLVGAANLVFGSGWTGHLGGAAALAALAVGAFAWSRLSYTLGTTKEERALSAIDLQAFKLHKAGKLAEAEPLYRQTREIAEAGGQPVLIATTLNNLAGLYIDQERWDEAEPLLRHALDLRGTNLGPDHELTRASVERLSGFLALRQRWPEAEQLQRRALTSYLRTRSQLPTVETYDAIGVACRHQGKYAEAESSYAEGQRLIQTGKLKDSPVAGQLLGDWAYLKVEQGQFDEAEAKYLNALKIRGSDTTVLDNLADLYTKLGRHQEAAEISRKQLLLMRMEIRSTLGRADHPALIPILEHHARRLEAAVRAADATSARNEAATIRQLHPDEA